MFVCRLCVSSVGGLSNSAEKRRNRRRLSGLQQEDPAHGLAPAREHDRGGGDKPAIHLPREGFLTGRDSATAYRAGERLGEGGGRTQGRGLELEEWRLGKTRYGWDSIGKGGVGLKTIIPSGRSFAQSASSHVEISAPSLHFSSVKSHGRR